MSFQQVQPVEQLCSAVVRPDVANYVNRNSLTLTITMLASDDEKDKMMQLLDSLCER